MCVNRDSKSFDVSRTNFHYCFSLCGQTRKCVLPLLKLITARTRRARAVVYYYYSDRVPDLPRGDTDAQPFSNSPQTLKTFSGQPLNIVLVGTQSERVLVQTIC